MMDELGSYRVSGNFHIVSSSGDFFQCHYSVSRPVGSGVFGFMEYGTIRCDLLQFQRHTELFRCFELQE